MTFNPFCIAGGESSTLTTHLYLQLSMVFRELHIHTLIDTQECDAMERSTEQWRESQIDGEKQRKEKKNDSEGQRRP